MKLVITYHTEDLIKHLFTKLGSTMIEAECYLKAAVDSIIKTCFMLKPLIYNQFAMNKDGTVKLRSDGKPRKKSTNASYFSIKLPHLGQFRLIHGGEKFNAYKDNLAIKFDYGPTLENLDDKLLLNLVEQLGSKSLSQEVLNYIAEFINDKCINEQAKVIIEDFGTFCFCKTSERQIYSPRAGHTVVPSKELIKFSYSSNVDYTTIVNDNDKVQLNNF